MIETELYYLLGASAFGLVSIIYILFGPNPNHSKLARKAPISGLVNAGNNCFTNSIIQAVANSESMINWLSKANASIDSRGKLIATINTLVECINEKTLSLLSPREVIACLTNYEYGFLFSGRQQDAHELFNAITTTLETELCFFSSQCLLDGMLDTQIISEALEKQSLNRASLSLFRSKLRSPPLPSRGMMGNHLTCHSCHYKYPLNLEIFNVVSLSLPSRNVSHISPFSLEDCIAHFISTETIDDFSCESCLSRSTFTKKIEFTKLPQLLCFHLQRLVWLGEVNSSNSSQLQKRFEQVVFPSTLVMDAFTYTHTLRKSIDSAGDHHEDTEPRYRYQISSIIVHYGGDSSGHYICYRRLQHRGQLKWFSVSDKDVCEIDEKFVFSCSAYMIFYERVFASNV